jgi:glutamine synthetase
METMSKVALRHNLVCLLHEKPFQGVNGSGKHNNWSIATDTGSNLLEPGTTPHDNQQFLVILAALIKAVDVHADILRASASNAGNDHRLGANEAPPAIISIFMGTELTRILEAIASGAASTSTSQSILRLGVDSLPPLPQDNTDRNRTSPFAFTGNKFEFRMMPSSASIAMGNTVLNTIVAEAFDEIATRLEKASDFSKEATQIIKDAMKNHGRIIFNGDGYSAAWKDEAAKRGLLNISNNVDAVKTYMKPKSIALFEKYKVLSKEETHSRVDVMLDQYSHHVNIEAQTAIRMTETQYFPAIIKYTKQLADTVVSLKDASASSKVQEDLLTKASNKLESAAKNLQALKEVAQFAKAQKSVESYADACRDKTMPALKNLRDDIDAIEMLSESSAWPVPGYVDLLFGIH